MNASQNQTFFDEIILALYSPFITDQKRKNEYKCENGDKMIMKQESNTQFIFKTTVKS